MLQLPVCVVGKKAANTGGEEAKVESHIDSSEVKTSGDVAEPVGEWCEASTPEGYVYYWNTVTKGETSLVFVWPFFTLYYLNTVLGFCLIFLLHSCCICVVYHNFLITD